ncbi:MAG: penicillin acylase family protein [Planctomycetales bacterium]
MSREQFDEWWRAECAARVPAATGTVRTGVNSSVRIERDAWGLPHVFASNDDDLFFGFGFATAQDRLFQLDYLRRRALGRLAEVLGPEALEIDLTARTVGLHRIAEAEWDALPEETRRLTAAYSQGVNAAIDGCRGKLPIEFDLLGYAPEPWRPQDSLAIAGEFRWYLTGRFPVIVIPELAKRALGEGALYQALLQAEADAEAILPPEAYPARAHGVQPVGKTINDPSEGIGSNNWVVSGARSLSGKPLVASDPHIAFAAVSCWHEVRLSGGSFNVTGTAYAGMPALLFGRNERVAWGITNNICSQRDLYQERVDPAHPGCFQYDGNWEQGRERREVIQVKGQGAVEKTIRLSRNGPIVDEILPPPARGTGPVSLRWVGAAPCGWVTSLLGMNRAKSGDELRRATEPWLVPTFCVVYGDVEGHIGYQCTGRLPIRAQWERGYRPGWDPAHQWVGLIPFEGMPHWKDPERGWIGTANHRVAADDYPYPLSGTWSSGFRGVRIREMLATKAKFQRDDFARMHQDSLSLRAIDCVPRLLNVLHAAASDPPSRPALPRASQLQLRQAVELLAQWDCRMEPDRVGASIFNVFFAHWCQHVAEERFSGETAVLIAGAINGLAGDLLHADPGGWFSNSQERRPNAIVETFLATLAYLSKQCGSEVLTWSWGRLHTLQQKHFLSGRGDLGQLLDRGGVPVRGDFLTVCNTGQAADFSAPTGAGYRLIADLADPQAGLWAVDAGSESGHPGSPHYDDQLSDWLTARYHFIPLTPSAEERAANQILTLIPQAAG